MTDQQMIYFLTLVQEKSFSKSAKQLYITQPSFSQYILKLENQIGARLFDRSVTPICLTPEGEAVYEAICDIRAINDNLQNRLHALSSLEYGKLSIGVTPLRGSTLLSQSIKRYHDTYPSIDLSIIEDSLPNLQTALLQGECDIAIASGKIDHNLFHEESLADETLYLAIAANHPFCAAHAEDVLTPEDINSNPLKPLMHRLALAEYENLPRICYDGRESLSTQANLIYEQCTCKPQTIIHVHNMYTAFSFVLSGLGAALVPDTMIRYGNFSTHPAYFSIDSIHARDSILLISKKNRSFSPCALSYSTMLKEMISSGTWRNPNMQPGGNE